jgi:hypothetical protein
MIEDKLKQIQKMTDPVERARVLHYELLPGVAEIRRNIIELRALAIKESCEFGGTDGDGLSYSAMAGELTVSKPLIQQMVALARKIIAGDRSELE